MMKGPYRFSDLPKEDQKKINQLQVAINRSQYVFDACGCDFCKKKRS